MKNIEIKNRYLKFIFDTIKNFELDIPEAAARRRFLRSLKVVLEDFYAVQNDLQRKYAEKDGDSPKMEKDRFVFSAKASKEVNKEFEKLCEQGAIIDVTPANEKDIETVREIFAREAKSEEAQSEGKFLADKFDYIESLKEVAESLTQKEKQ